MKKVIAILLGLVLSFGIVFVLPNYFSEPQALDVEHINEVSVIPQKVLGYSDSKNTYYKLYHNDDLIGVICDLDKFNETINKDYADFEELYPDSSLGLVTDCYIVDETSNIIFENIDSEIAEYAKNGDSENGSYIGINTTAVEFSNSDGVYEIIYVSSKDLFNEALNDFLENFASADAINRTKNDETIDSPTTFGSVDMNVRIDQNIDFTESIVSFDDVLTTKASIYEFLCYGRDEERQYYETKVGDTVQAVGYHFGDMTSKQIMMLNPDIIYNEDQILAPGTKLNVTYYKSPIDVYVTKQRLTQETVLPDTPLYKEDDTLKKGSRKIEVEEENGLKNVLYEEIWVNGVVQEGTALSSNMIKEPTQGVIAVGTMVLPDVGTGNWRYPVNNPIITCNYTCYANHGGIDFQNLYSKWDLVYASDSGVVEGVGYTSIGGYYVRINHNNNYITYYGHMRTYPYVEVGQIVERGEVLGPIGMTGVATGPHVHFAIYYYGRLVDPCSVISCSLR